MITYKVTKISGKGSISLSQWENHLGDKWWVIKNKTYSDNKREINTMIDFTSKELAMIEYNKMIGTN